MDRVIFFGSWCAWGVVEHVSRIFLASLLCAPSGWGLVLNLCNFWILPVRRPVWVLVGLFLVGFGLFTACFFLKLFVESLILAQDERWRRA